MICLKCRYPDSAIDIPTIPETIYGDPMSGIVSNHHINNRNEDVADITKNINILLVINERKDVDFRLLRLFFFFIFVDGLDSDDGFGSNDDSSSDCMALYLSSCLRLDLGLDFNFVLSFDIGLAT